MYLRYSEGCGPTSFLVGWSCDARTPVFLVEFLDPGALDDDPREIERGLQEVFSTSHDWKNMYQFGTKTRRYTYSRPTPTKTKSLKWVQYCTFGSNVSRRCAQGLCEP